MCWPATCSAASGVHLVQLEITAESRWELVTIVNPKEWFAQDLIPLCPAVVRHIGGAELPLSLTLQAVDDPGPLPLSKFAGRVGFRGLSVPNVQKYYRFRRVTEGLPIGAVALTERAVVIQLLRDVFPTASPDTINTYWQRRHLSEKPRYACIMKEDDVKVVLDEAANSEEEEDIRQTFADLKPKRPGKGRGKGGRGGRGGSGPVKKDVDIDPLNTVDGAKEYIPDVVGCTIKKDPDRKRWQVTHPNSDPPPQKKSTSQAFGVAGDRAALLHCLLWVWAEHLRDTEEECPWQFF